MIIPEAQGTNFMSNVTGVSMSGAATFTFDAVTDVLALVCRVPLTGTLTGMDFRTGTVSTAGADFNFGLYTVDASGLPTTTPLVANSFGVVTVATGDDNVWKQVAINSGTGVSVTRGQLCSMSLSISGVGVPNTVQISGLNNQLQYLSNFPYRCENTTLSIAKASSNVAVPFAWNYGGTYVYCDGCIVVNSGAFQTPGNGNERALRFQYPAPIRVAGCKIALNNVAAGADFQIRLSNAAGTTLAAIEAGPADIDGDGVQGTTVDGTYTGYFDTSVQLSANTPYYLSVLQQTANALQTAEVTVSAAGYMAAVPGGAEFYLGTRSGGTGGFSDTTTTRPLMWLLPDGVDDGTGGGGGGGIRMAGHGGLAA